MRRQFLCLTFLLVGSGVACDYSEEHVTVTRAEPRRSAMTSRVDRSRIRMPNYPPPRATAYPVMRQVAAAPVPSIWMPPANSPRRQWKTIVVHHSATDRGSATEFDKFHKGKGWDELGYHFVIGNGKGSGDGQVEVGSRWTKQKHGAHCRTPRNEYNEHGIGICLVGDFTRSTPTAAQLRSLYALVSFLKNNYRISPAAVVSHGEVTGKTQCPGPLMNMHALRQSVANASVLATSH